VKKNEKMMMSQEEENSLSSSQKKAKGKQTNWGNPFHPILFSQSFPF